MLELIVNAIAVPFGYTSEFNESEASFFGDSFPCTSFGMWMQDSRTTSGWSLLPDVVQSNTPPPSPLRRALSSSFVFHEKARSQTQDCFRPEAGGDRENSTPAQLEISRTQEEDNCSSNGHRVSSSLLQEANHSLSSNSDNGCHPDIPELTWKLPRLVRSPPDLCQEALQKEVSITQGAVAEVSEYRKLCAVGCDLRKIADQFGVENAKVNGKREEETELRLTIPEALTKCVTVSIMFFVWWRLIRKLQ
ncbi:uncharacterized protein LOC135221511 [Macrobrachium nipponense]|uniref:uncharacterized protein LOC135221511 n=1 Tax=Macrobrachium nipponense TaxID=159736 RepID=UPI0030C8259A